jgi:hypothetical protein
MPCGQSPQRHYQKAQGCKYFSSLDSPPYEFGIDIINFSYKFIIAHSLSFVKYFFQKTNNFFCKLWNNEKRKNIQHILDVFIKRKVKMYSLSWVFTHLHWKLSFWWKAVSQLGFSPHCAKVKNIYFSTALTWAVHFRKALRKWLRGEDSRNLRFHRAFCLLFSLFYSISIAITILNYIWNKRIIFKNHVFSQETLKFFQILMNKLCNFNFLNSIHNLFIKLKTVSHSICNPLLFTRMPNVNHISKKNVTFCK